MYFNSRPSARGDALLVAASDKAGDISIHAPPRGATRWEKYINEQYQFQFTPLREGRQSRHSACPTWIYFNSRPSARGDDEAKRQGFPDTFQFTPLREGRRYMVKKGEHAALFQFTPLREGRRDRWQMYHNCQAISIHAPPRGATLHGANPHAAGRISIHAPPRGATVMPGLARYVDLFQFTPLREGRQNRRNGLYATNYFNSRPSARGDGAWCVLGILESHFNSRPSARGDTC